MYSVPPDRVTIANTIIVSIYEEKKTTTKKYHLYTHVVSNLMEAGRIELYFIS